MVSFPTGLPTRKTLGELPRARGCPFEAHCLSCLAGCRHQCQLVLAGGDHIQLLPGHSPAVKPDTCPGCTRWQTFAFLSVGHIPRPTGHLVCFCQGRSTLDRVHICTATCPARFAFLRVWLGCRGMGVLGVLPFLPLALQQQ